MPVKKSFISIDLHRDDFWYRQQLTMGHWSALYCAPDTRSTRSVSAAVVTIHSSAPRSTWWCSLCDKSKPKTKTVKNVPFSSHGYN